MSRHVAVLMGGWSSEREVSLVSGAACAKALGEEGYRVSEIDVDRNLAGVLEELRPDVVFNALHGRWGEDGCVQGLLEILGLPYTHSGVRSSALAMHKPSALEIFRCLGIPCPEGRVVGIDEVNRRDPLPRPYVVKPVAEGSTCGVRIVRPGDNAPPIAADWPYEDDLLAECFIPGRELTVAVMDGGALGVTEIRPHGGFYDYEAKYTDGKADHFVPAPIHADVYAEAMRLAEQAHAALGCRGVSRADFRYDDTAGEPGRLYMLEVNTQPGMTPLSLVPEIAAYREIGFGALVRWMVEDAGCAR
ncbi:MAG: D-alanine--D-alanine ligase [Alphaproteobacteria bacterium]|jgi:D-alanine-D-alanine ligase|nr:D-alanine--D-alanine ligase [Alphaproteobacteria bacterium]MDP6566353.1 D-alanine--D-alanine ligase [Alphaproteobacteria bacterium]MDP6812513.1 D-alanine--D-alanine ligase [Alphaproteobacteria bacterium]